MLLSVSGQVQVESFLIKMPNTFPEPLNPVYMEQNYLDRNRDANPEAAPVYTGHSLFNITKNVTIVFIVQSLFDDPEITIHPISGLKLSRSSVYTGQNFSPDQIGLNTSHQ